jgi:hypothetical protein
MHPPLALNVNVSRDHNDIHISAERREGLGRNDGRRDFSSRVVARFGRFAMARSRHGRSQRIVEMKNGPTRIRFVAI